VQYELFHYIDFMGRNKITLLSPCPHLTADTMQYVCLNAFDLIAGVFYSGILLLKMAF